MKNKIVLYLKTDDYEEQISMEAENIFDVVQTDTSISFSVTSDGFTTEHWINKNEIVRYEFTEVEE